MKVAFDEILVSEEFRKVWERESRIVADEHLSLKECLALCKEPNLIEEYFEIGEGASEAIAKMGDRVILRIIVGNGHWKLRRDA